MILCVKLQGPRQTSGVILVYVTGGVKLDRQNLFSSLHLATSSDRLLMFTFLSACKISSFSRRQRGQHLVALEYAGVWATTDQLMLYPAFLRFMSQIMSFDNSALFSIRSCLIHVMCPSYRFLNVISVRPRYSFRLFRFLSR